MLACSDFVANTLARDAELASDLIGSGDLAGAYPHAEAGEERPASFEHYRALAPASAVRARAR